MASTSSVTPSKARAPIFSNLLLSIEKLDGSNYSNRTSEVTLWISRLGYKSHLTSTIDSILAVDRAQWAKIDANLCSVIKSTLHPSLKSIFLPHIICKSVWTEARALYTNDTQQLKFQNNWLKQNCSVKMEQKAALHLLQGKRKIKFET